MDRQTLANAATRITRQFALSQEQYGDLEFAFGWAFAVGSLGFGILADLFPVRWVYPLVLALWSATGFATGLVKNYEGLLICRTLLGLFESGHWPCAVKTTQRLLVPRDRSMGNSLLQSGTSIGAVAAPLAMRLTITDELSSWRRSFLAVGALGLVWIIAWFALVRSGELDRPTTRAEGVSTGIPSKAEGIWRVLLTRRMLIVLVIVSLINTGWQTVRAWLPKFLQEGRGFPEVDVLYFNSVFYLATDAGVIGSGLLALWLSRHFASVTHSRLIAFGACALLSSCAIGIPTLPANRLLLGLLLVMGAGLLGVFPIYHAFTQDVSEHHQGKVTGIASVAAWAFAPPAQKFFGRLVDRTHSFDTGFVIAGMLPLAATVVLLLFWRDSRTGDL
jgi:ACS family hexuronate transporter-like MFS transporter